MIHTVCKRHGRLNKPLCGPEVLGELVDDGEHELEDRTKMKEEM
jgi:hypothetical protein